MIASASSIAHSSKNKKGKKNKAPPEPEEPPKPRAPLMAWEMKARAAVADRAEKRRSMANKFGQKNKGKHNSMADFLREFENNVSLQVEQLRG